MSGFRSLVAAVAMLGMVLVGSGGPGRAGATASHTQSEAPTRGGNLVFARSSDLKSLDPTVVADNESIWAQEQVYQMLYTVSRNGQSVIPQLATSYSISSNKLTWTFHLRRGVKFSNGKPVTAKDVKFSIDRARNSTKGFGYIDAAIKSISAPNASTVVIRTKYRWAPLLADMSLFVNGVIPANFGGMKPSKFFQHPIGTGPFKVQNWNKGQQLKLVRNPYYWQKGKPYLNSVTLTNVPNDNTRQLQVQGGQAQIDEFPPLSSVTSLKSKPGIVVTLFPSTRTDYILLNEKVAPYSDVHVRRAISYALDRRALVRAALFGNGSTANSFMPPTLRFYSKSARCNTYSLTKAKQEMAKSKAKDGFKTVFLTDSSAQDTAVAQIAQQELKPLGIKVSIQTIDPNQIFTVQGKEDYKMSIDYWTMDIPDPDEIAEFFLNPKRGGARSYYTQYNSRRMVRLVTQAASEFSNSKRATLYAQIQNLQCRDLPQIPLYYSPFAYAYSTKVRGFAVYPLGNYHLEDVWLSK